MDKLSLQDHIGKIRAALCDKGMHRACTHLPAVASTISSICNMIVRDAGGTITISIHCGCYMCLAHEPDFAT
jgi:hypothetical protein